MTTNKHGSIHFTYSRILFFYIALLLLVIPFRLLFAAIFSAAVHEVFHIGAIRFMGIQVYTIHIGVCGAKIHTQQMSEKQELLCALSGPLGGLLLFLLFRWIPVISLCGLVQSLYNLLPLYPTDGGRLLRCSTGLLFSQKIAEKVVYIIEIITLSAIVAVSVYGSLWLRLGIVPLIFCFSLLVTSAKRK